MFNLTQQERQAILFLITVALIGIGVNFAVNSNTRLKHLMTADSNIAKINLNQISLADLSSSRCLSQKQARKIIEYRNLVGSFRGLEDLKEIKGLSDSRYEKLKELFFVE